MTDWYDFVEVPAGPGHYERAMFEAVRKYGLDIALILDQAGSTPDLIRYTVELVDE